MNVGELLSSNRLTFFLSLFCLYSSGQQFEGYIAPVDIPIAVTGTFSEYRRSHFHTGLDIGTNRQKGLNIYSVNDGWISRIKISTTGYGKVLYILHPDGNTSVYAHLDKFSPKIQQYIKQKQYQTKQYEVDIYPKTNELLVSKGQIIGFSGNTGSSFGPHLHFEIRDPSNVPMNPLILPMDVPDSVAPIISNVFVYHYKGKEISSQKLQLVETGYNEYRASSIKSFGRVSLGIEMHDRSNLSYNVNGVYSVRIFQNGQTKLYYKFDKIKFNDSQYLNLLIDYPVYRSENQRIQRLKLHPENKGSIFNSELDGILKIENDSIYDVEVWVEDFHKNRSVIRLEIIGDNLETHIKTKTEELTGNLLKRNESLKLKYGSKGIFFPKGTFYSDVRLKINQNGDTLFIDQDRFPIANQYEIRYDLSDLDSSWSDHSYIARLDKNNKVEFVSANKVNMHLTARLKQLGTYFLSMDNIPPIIKPINFASGSNVLDKQHLSIRVTDNLGSLSSYSATIDDDWVLFEYEPKDNLLTFDLNDIRPLGKERLLVIEATDKVGNTTRNVYSISY